MGMSDSTAPPLEVVQVVHVHHSIIRNLKVHHSIFSILFKPRVFGTKIVQNITLCTTQFKILKEVLRLFPFFCFYDCLKAFGCSVLRCFLQLFLCLFAFKAKEKKYSFYFFLIKNLTIQFFYDAAALMGIELTVRFEALR